MNIENYIGVGKQNAVTRAELSALLNLPDRKVRRLIQEARERGEIIINSSDGAGYFRSNEIADIERQMRTNNNRALAVLRQQTHLRRKLRELEGSDQIDMEEVADIGCG